MSLKSWKLDILSKQTNGNILHLVCNCPEIFDVVPGQFFQLVVSEMLDVFLPRPISVMNCEDGILEFLVKIKGRGTSCLNRFKVGDQISVVGPLGNGFSIPRKIDRVVLLAGGIGVAPLIFLEKYLIKNSVDYEFFWGLKDIASFNSFPVKPRHATIVTEDGSIGMKGKITNILVNLPSKLYYICGPIGMMNSIFKGLIGRSVVAQFSLESRMACGWGGCKGCYIEFAGRSLYVCKDGPVVEVLC